MLVIQGHFDEYHQPRVAITIQGARRDATLDAVIDTGFDGYLCLPVAVAIELGLELYGAQRTELADGSIKSELVFIGRAGFAGQPSREVEILLTEGEEALIGVGFLADWRLELDFPQGTVRIHSL
ncbi:MAG: hypothetical protein NUW06_00355 [Candidatus Acetothermia bacterium]|jgi:clan AA aspartic protease|nr:hypothetical protein [Candidatus Acetothermia bacterium]MDH7504965.1 hypothetical protein [Candidatus Acetothermia bacterium]